jgi:UDP-N-acetylglucosamine acyltransferase
VAEVHPAAVVGVGAERDFEVTIGSYAVTGRRIWTWLHTRTRNRTIVLQDIPPDLTAQGNHPQPCGLDLAGLLRRGVARATSQALKETYRIVFKCELKTSHALAQMEAVASSPSEALRFVDCIESSRRGIGT